LSGAEALAPFARGYETLQMAEIVTIGLEGLRYASYLFIVAVGLTVIFGVMKVLNVTHGALYSFGAYTMASLAGAYSQVDDLPAFGVYGILLLSAVGCGIVIGVIVERGLLRLLYGRDEVVVVLATFAAFLVLEDVVLLIWGVDPYFATEAQDLLDTSEVAGMLFYNYTFLLIAIAVVLALALWFGLRRTRWGKLLLAVIYDREMSQAMGINVTAVFLVTFVLGSILGALGGALVAPTISVAPGIGVEVIVLAFAVVVIGGMGSIPGALIGALIVGIARSIAVFKFPEVELFVIYAIMAAVLAIRPEGLFVPVKPRKI